MSQTNATATRALSFLMYDIPEVSNLDNPSCRLRRLGVRINKSVWIIPTESMPYMLLNSLTEGGAVWHSAPFADNAGEALVAMGTAFLTKEIQEMTARLEESFREYGNKLDSTEVTTEDERQAAAKKYQSSIRAAIRRCERMLEESAEGAAAVGIDVTTLSGLKEDMCKRASAVYTAAHIRANTYALAVAQIADSNPLKAVAESDEGIPSYVLADILTEQAEEGCEVSGSVASDVRQAFLPF
jgi:hypothetical protein